MLSQRSKYALRAMTMLAASKPGDLVLVADIARQRKVPRKFLELILLDLKKRGLLHAKRGKNGGYCLARPANKITFGEIVRITDGPLAPLACASRHPGGGMGAAPPIHPPIRLLDAPPPSA